MSDSVAEELGLTPEILNETQDLIRAIDKEEQLKAEILAAVRAFLAADHALHKLVRKLQTARYLGTNDLVKWTEQQQSEIRQCDSAKQKLRALCSRLDGLHENLKA